MNVSVTRAGFLTTVQDLGRTGHRQSGVSLGGALDPHALKVVNLLVGNEASAAGIEATLGQLRTRFDDERLVAWAGGAFNVRVAELELPPGRPAWIKAGEELLVVAPEGGARAWLGISGGIDVPLVLGSRSTDLRSNFGGFEGRALRDGDLLALGPPSTEAPGIVRKIGEARIASWGATSEWASTAPRHPFLRIVRGADWARFGETALTCIVNEPFTVTSDSDRMGIRFDGPQLAAPATGELVSEAVAPGTIQVPPGGHPILLLGDCQTIGGYPKIAHVITVDLPAAAQLRPGDLARFAEVSLADAPLLLVERERDLQRFRIGLSLQTL